MRGGWGVLETGKPSVECEHKSKTQLCRDRAAEKRAKGEWVPLAIMTVATQGGAAAAARQGASLLAALAGDRPATRQEQAAGSAPRQAQASGAESGPAGSDESRRAAAGMRGASPAEGLPGPAAGATAGARAGGSGPPVGAATGKRGQN